MYFDIQVTEVLQLFIIKYSMDGMRSMNRHKDKDGAISGIIKLNNNFKGCRLRFPDHNIDVGASRTGHIVQFPRNYDYEVTELTEGKRFSMAMWVK